MRSLAARKSASLWASRSSRGVGLIGRRLQRDGCNDVAVSEEAEAVEPSEPQPHAVAPAAAAELISGGAMLIDVRRDYEFEAGHLQGARNIEMNELPGHAEEI